MDPVHQPLRERNDVETAGFILAERLAGGDTLLARRVRSFPTTVISSGLIIYASIRSRSTAYPPGPSPGLSVLTMHTHPARMSHGSQPLTTAMPG